MRTLRKSGRKQQASGFTLIEMLVIVAVLGILALIAVPRLVCHIQRSKFTSGMNDLMVTRDLVELYEIEHGDFPVSLEAVYGDREPPKTVRYCYDSDLNRGHGNDCDFFDEDNPSGNNKHGGFPGQGYMLYTIKSIGAPCVSAEWAFTACCGMEAIEVPPDSDMRYPGTKGGGKK